MKNFMQNFVINVLRELVVFFPILFNKETKMFIFANIINGVIVGIPLYHTTSIVFLINIMIALYIIEKSFIFTLRKKVISINKELIISDDVEIRTPNSIIEEKPVLLSEEIIKPEQPIETKYFQEEIFKYSISSELLPVLIGEKIEDMATFPHFIMMGITGSGKSCLLNTMIQSSMLFNDDILYILIDFKTLEFSPYAKFDNVVFANSMDDLLKILLQLYKIAEEREQLFSEFNCKNIKQYNNFSDNPIPFIEFIIDEASCIVLDKNKKLGNKINDLLLEGINKWRALGIHIGICLQRASAEQIPTDIRAQFGANICCRVEGNDGAFIGFKKEDVNNLPVGRFMFRHNNILEERQSSFIQEDMSIALANEIFERLYLVKTGEEYHYLNKNCTKREFDHQLFIPETNLKVLELRNIFITKNSTHNDEEKILKKYLENFKIFPPLKQIENDLKISQLKIRSLREKFLKENFLIFENGKFIKNS